MSKEHFFNEQRGTKEAQPLQGKVALVTGSGRDIGAAISLELARKGAVVVGNYRRRAEDILGLSRKIHDEGGQFKIACADVAKSEDRERMLQTVKNVTFPPRLDVLVLNASANDRENKGYAHTMNVEVPNALVDQYLPIMREGGKIIYMQSVPALRYGSYDEELLPDVYKSVASTKHDGEQSLRNRIPEFDERGVRLAVVCPPIVPDTFNARYFGRRAKDFGDFHNSLVEEINRENGTATAMPYVVSTQEIGLRVAELAAEDIQQGYTELFMK